MGLKNQIINYFVDASTPPRVYKSPVTMGDKVALTILNKEFIGCDPDQDRILQYIDEPCFIYFLRNNISTAIPLPIQSEPGDLSFV